MASESRTITDPFNNLVYITDAVCLYESETESFLEDARMVISRPAICVEKKNESPVMYYYRSVDWHHTMLISVQLVNEKWETIACERDPTTERLAVILKSGKQLI